jgi:hypothetical protein
MFVVGVAATRDVWVDIWRTAMHHGEIGHLLLVPLVVFWLVWVRRERARLCEPVGTWIGPVIVGVSWCVAALGELMGYKVFTHAGAVGIMVGCLLSVLGWDVLRRFLPAFGALGLLIPAPWLVHERLADPFTDFVAEFSLLVYNVLGISAQMRGPVMIIEDTRIPVLAVTGAPGLKAIFLAAYGFAFAQPLRRWARGLVLASTPIAAVMCQILGAPLVAWLVTLDEVNPEWLSAVAGWLLLPVVFGILFGLVRLLNWASVPIQQYTLAQEH